MISSRCTLQCDNGGGQPCLILVLLFLQGMAYLHNSDVNVHGKLRSCNCLIDGRFVLKISDFGLRTLRTPHEFVRDQTFYNSKFSFWLF